MVTIGVLHPGEMGAAIGGQLRARGNDVLWASAGRSGASAERAAAAGLDDAGNVAGLARRSDVILSVCPPHAAAEVAAEVAAEFTAGRDERRIFVEANAISPAATRQIERVVTGGGADFVDGGIVGPPPAPGTTRMYLSGPRAGAVRDLFAGTAVDAHVVDGGAGAASAVKMSYAAWTKGTTALVLAVRALARAEGVEGVLLDEWAVSQPDLARRSQEAARSALTKGWRWVAEMEEISATFAAAGLPAGFHQAAAEIFRNAPGTVAATADEAAVDRVAAALIAKGATPGGGTA